MRVHPIQSFVGEYKKFVNRGNVVDMAVGVIIGGAFTAIVTALSGSILEPIINFALSEWFGSAHTDGLYNRSQRRLCRGRKLGSYCFYLH